MAGQRIIIITMRNPKWQFPIVILILLAAIFAPVVYSGYANIKQAEAALSTGNYLDSAASFEFAARLLPWRADLWEQAGQAAFYGQDYSNSIRFYKKTKSAESHSNKDWHLLGLSYWLTENHAAAQSTWLAGASADPSYAPFYDALAISYREQKNYTAERDALKRWVELEPESAPAHYRLGLILTVLDSENAAADLMLASSLDPQFDPVVQTLRTALNLSATQADASQQMVTIGRALGLVNEWALATFAFQKALDLDGKNAEAWAWLGEAHQQRGENGRVELDQALSLNRQSVIVLALRGLYWNRQGKYSQALAEYQTAARIEPASPAWQASIGDAYTRLGDLAAALPAYQRAAELAPNEMIYWRLLAVFCADNGIHVEDVGLPAAQKAAQLAPQDVEALDALGYVYFSSGRFFTAEQTLLDVIRRAPDYLPARLHLAMTYLSQGKRESAYAELIHVRDADPSGANGQFAAQLLNQYFP